MSTFTFTLSDRAQYRRAPHRLVGKIGCSFCIHPSSVVSTVSGPPPLVTALRVVSYHGRFFKRIRVSTFGRAGCSPQSCRQYCEVYLPEVKNPVKTNVDNQKDMNRKKAVSGLVRAHTLPSHHPGTIGQKDRQVNERFTSRPYETSGSEYWLQRRSPARTTVPAATRAASSRCIVFSLTSRSTVEISLI